jgi:hypothetical protein
MEHLPFATCFNLLSNLCLHCLASVSTFNLSVLQSNHNLSSGKDDEAPADDEGLPELERLAFVVQQIDNECSVVPRGAMQLTAAKEVVPTKDFAGTQLFAYFFSFCSLVVGARHHLFGCTLQSIILAFFTWC